MDLKGVRMLSDGFLRMAGSRRRIDVALPQELISVLDERASELGKSRTEVIENALIRYLQGSGEEG